MLSTVVAIQLSIVDTLHAEHVSFTPAQVGILPQGFGPLPSLHVVLLLPCVHRAVLINDPLKHAYFRGPIVNLTVVARYPVHCLLPVSP